MALEKKEQACSNCGKLESEHVAVFMPDDTGELAASRLRICPKAVFRPMGKDKS